MSKFYLDTSAAIASEHCVPLQSIIVTLAKLAASVFFLFEFNYTENVWRPSDLVICLIRLVG